MADWSKPTLTSTYTNFLTEVKNRDDDLAKQFDGTTSSNVPTGAIRWDSSANRWKKWSGSAWDELTATYALTALSLTGVASFAAGTAAAPALTRTGDLNTGIFFPAADTLAAATAGVERLRIDGSGRVGIGTDSPSTLLHINGATPTIRLVDTDGAGEYSQINANNASGSIVIQADVGNTAASTFIGFDTDGTERMRIDADGRALLGTTSRTGVSTAWGGLFIGSNAVASTANAIVFGETEAATASNLPLICQRSSDGAAQDLALVAHSSGSAIRFFTGASTSSVPFSGSNVERLQINASGAIGIAGANFGTSGQVLTSGGPSAPPSWESISVAGLFRKQDPAVVAWTKTGNGTATTATILYIEVNGSIKTIASGTSITMPTLTAGTDYAIWAKTDGTLEATSNHTSPPTANARKVGGFHYAPGGNATGRSGGNTTAQINEYSFWDLKFRPACPDPRGMTLVGGGFWADIYLTGVDAITNGSSKYNVTMADGSSPPKVPTMFGGDGSTTYGSYTWFEAMELATAFGKKCPTQMEFMSLAYGTTEASSVGTDQVSTVLNAAYTSKWGVIQSAGVLYVWARDRGGPAAAASWNANTEGRGSEFNAPNAGRLGGAWTSGSDSGSRCSAWNFAASASDSNIGSRFVCDHLQLD